MRTMDDRDLLAAYVRDRSEAAFGELVRRHLAWVYSVALRHLGNPALAEDVAQTRALLAAQSVPSVSQPMLTILVSWLVVIFVGFSVLAPPNATTVFALMISALAVSGAIFLILELDQPFGGLIGISSEPMVKALHQLEQ